MRKVEKVVERQHLLAESPAYDSRTGILSWVDLKAGNLHFLGLDGGTYSIGAGQFAGALLPSSSGDYIAALTTGIYRFSKEAAIVERLPDSAPSSLRLRYNDSKCDAHGRLWSGTMGLFNSRKDKGVLYRFDSDGSRRQMLKDVGISNGMCWSGDNRTMYFIDSLTYGVDAFDFDSDSGSIANRRTVVPVSSGLPDGMSIDMDGMLWVCIWGEGCIRRYDPNDGRLLEQVDLPAKFATSCCFGGEGLDTLYITTASEPEPESLDAGCIFSLRTGTVGFACVPFEDEGEWTSWIS
jgi:sugar lactone lactonase YvrE